MFRRMMPLCLTSLCLFACAPVHAEIQSYYANTESTSEEVRHFPEPTTPTMSVIIGEFHDRGSVLTMDIPSTDTPFVKQHLHNGDTVFINNQFANYHKTPLALAMVLSHHFPASDAASKTEDQCLDEIVAGFLDSMMTSAKLQEKELQRNESLLQNGSPARRLTIRSLVNGREIITDALFLSFKGDMWSIQLMYDTSDPIIPYHAAGLLDSAVIGTDAEELSPRRRQ